MSPQKLCYYSSLLYHLKEENLYVAKTVVYFFSKVLLLLFYLFLPQPQQNKFFSVIASLAANLF